MTPDGVRSVNLDRSHGQRREMDETCANPFDIDMQKDVCSFVTDTEVIAWKQMGWARWMV